MSRRAGRKRQADQALVSEDDEERKEDKRGKVDEMVASSSSSAAAAASPARPPLAPAAAASSSPAAAAASSRPPAAELEKVDCAQCSETFECGDSSGRLPRALPCSHVLCTSCVKTNLNRTPESVLCPEGHGPQQIRIPDGSAAAAMSTVDDWVRLLPPAKELIAAIRNQQSLMTRIGQQGARCSHAGCEVAVAHFCPECGDLCSVHERKRHSLAPFQSHKQSTVPIAQKAATLHSKLAGPAATIRAQFAAAILQQQQQLKIAEDDLKQFEAQRQKKIDLVQAKAQALSALQLTADRMRTADDSTVLELEADRLEAGDLAAVSRPAIDSTVLNPLPDDRIADLQTFLGAARSLSEAKLVYRATRNGQKPKDWWHQCGGKSNLLTLVRVKGNGFVFGTLTPIKWPSDNPPRYQDIADPSASTFLFSLVNAHGRAVKFRLKAGKVAGRVIPGHGPIFGDEDVGLMYKDRTADMPNGNWTRPNSFEFDSVADGGAPIVYDMTRLAVDDGRNADFVFFAAAEIETWQLSAPFIAHPLSFHTMSAPLPVFAPVNSAPELPPQSRAVGSTKASHQASKAAAANEAKRIAASELAAKRKALLQSNAPRLAVWGADRDRVALPASLANAALPFTPRFDHICLASSDVSHLSDFLSLSGGRACEGFLTPVYLSSTFEFANCAEMQVIAPVESFQRRKVKLNAQGQSTATTRAFWNGNSTPNPPSPQPPAAAAPGQSTLAAAATSTAAAPQQLQQQHSAAPMVASRRSTFLQRYLRRHGPSVHHVAFLVRDLKQAKERFQSFGYTVYGWSDRDPLWKEFFLTPKQSLGVVIQIAESGSFSHSEGMSWTSSSAMLSQTHLTPVVKKHIALISAQQEEWGPENPVANAALQTGKKLRESKEKKQALQTNRTAAASPAAGAAPAAFSSSSSSPPASTSAAAAAPASAISPLLPPGGRLDLLGLRMRCGSEFKARRQWGDMLAASHCTATVNPTTGIKTLVFRWPQSAMYIAVDIEKDPAATEAGAAARKDAATAKAARARSASPTPIVPGGVVEGPAHFAGEPRARPSSPGDRSAAAQWDGPKWIEMHAPGVVVGGSSSAAAAASPLSSSSAAAAPTAASSTSARGGPSSRSLGTGAPIPFVQRCTPLPLDPAIMRSAFVAVDQPLPLPLPALSLDTEKFSLTTPPVSIAQPLRAKM